MLKLYVAVCQDEIGYYAGQGNVYGDHNDLMGL